MKIDYRVAEILVRKVGVSKHRLESIMKHGGSIEPHVIIHSV